MTRTTKYLLALVAVLAVVGVVVFTIAQGGPPSNETNGVEVSAIIDKCHVPKSSLKQTDTEYRQVGSDPDKLTTYITTWYDTPKGSAIVFTYRYENRTKLQRVECVDGIRSDGTHIGDDSSPPGWEPVD